MVSPRCPHGVSMVFLCPHGVPMSPWCPCARAGPRGRERLFQFLLGVLERGELPQCVWWVQRDAGVFQFSSRHKETLARAWGRRKGNRRAMTYPKLARALRTYARTGEVRKVRRKLTYRFGPALLPPAPRGPAGTGSPAGGPAATVGPMAGLTGSPGGTVDPLGVPPLTALTPRPPGVGVGPGRLGPLYLLPPPRWRRLKNFINSQ
uniref:ETS domain-containing protein n=1 Tax=Apteryx owenii TaxID=8824 RepID=A0A8B9QI12_APTOW